MSVVTRAKKYNIKSLQKIVKTLPKTIKRVRDIYNELKATAERGESINEDYKWYLADHFGGMMLDPVLMSDEDYREEFSEHLKHLISLHEAIHRQLNSLRTPRSKKNISYKRNEQEFKKEVVARVNEAIVNGKDKIVIRSYDKIPLDAINWVQTLNGVRESMWAFTPGNVFDVNPNAIIIRINNEL